MPKFIVQFSNADNFIYSKIVDAVPLHIFPILSFAKSHHDKKRPPLLGGVLDYLTEAMNLSIATV